MFYRALMIAGIFMGMEAASIGAQTVPPETWDASVGKETQDSRKLLSKEESVTRIREARELFRKGALKEADSKLRGPDFAVDLNLSSGSGSSGTTGLVAVCETRRSLCHPFRGRSRVVYYSSCVPSSSVDSSENAIDPREIDVVLAIAYYVNDDFRAAFNAAEKVHESNKPGSVNVEAALLKSLVFYKVGVLPLSIGWAKRIQELDPGNPAGVGMLKFFAEKGEANYTLADPILFPADSRVNVNVWRSARSLQPLVFEFQSGSDFLGALAVESFATKPGAPREHVLKFYDLDGPPLLALVFGPKEPGEPELRSLVAKLTPKRVKGQSYSTIRAELEALVSERKGITPLAAHWAKQALPSGSREALRVQKKLQAEGAWNWESGGQRVSSGQYNLVGYVNSDVSSAKPGNEVHDSLEHFHFLVLSKGENAYLASFVLSSSALGDGRAYVLSYLSDGLSEALEAFPEPPSYTQVLASVQKHIGAKGSMAKNSGKE